MKYYIKNLSTILGLDKRIQDLGIGFREKVRSEE